MARERMHAMTIPLLPDGGDRRERRAANGPGNARGGTTAYPPSRVAVANGRAANVARGVLIVAAAIAAMAMVMAALWAWQGAADMVADWDVVRPEAAIWAIRSGAIASAALAQVVIVGVIAGQIFPRRTGDQAVVIAAAGAFVLAVIAAVALAMAGR